MFLENSGHGLEVFYLHFVSGIGLLGAYADHSDDEGENGCGLINLYQLLQRDF